MGQGSIVADLLAEFPIKTSENEERWKDAFNNYLTRRECAEYQIDALSKTLYGEYGKLPEDTHRYSDMWTALRHLQYQLHPTDDWDIRASKPFAMSDYPMIKVKEVKNE